MAAAAWISEDVKCCGLVITPHLITCTVEKRGVVKLEGSTHYTIIFLERTRFRNSHLTEGNERGVVKGSTHYATIFLERTRFRKGHLTERLKGIKEA